MVWHRGFRYRRGGQLERHRMLSPWYPKHGPEPRGSASRTFAGYESLSVMDLSFMAGACSGRSPSAGGTTVEAIQPPVWGGRDTPGRDDLGKILLPGSGFHATSAPRA